MPVCSIHASARISTVGIAGSTGSSGLVLRRPLLGNWFLSAIFLILSIFTSGISAQDVSCALPTEVLRQERVRVRSLLLFARLTPEVLASAVCDVSLTP